MGADLLTRPRQTMLLRTVRMTFDPAFVDDFLDLFSRVRPKIAAAPGCQHLELWRDARFPNVLTTFSRWDDDAALQAYRRSDLFRETWALTVPFFAAAPVAFSQHVVE